MIQIDYKVCTESGPRHAEGYRPAAGEIWADKLVLSQSYLLLGEEQYLSMFAEAYASAMHRMRLAGDFARFGWLVDVQVDTGAVSRVFISSLSAFWPGMQALVGAHAAQSPSLPPAIAWPGHVSGNVSGPDECEAEGTELWLCNKRLHPSMGLLC